MDYFINTYKKRCKEEFNEYGFKTYRNNHYRVINDIFQSFTLHRSVSGNDCNVIFGIVPLAVEYDLDKSFVNPCRISDFGSKNPWFNYDRTLHSSIDICIDNMFRYMKKYLMPIFAKAVDCETAYSIICEYDSVFAGNSYERFCFCLKFGDYKTAKFHLEEVIEQHNIAFRRNKEVFGKSLNQEYVQKMAEKLSKKQFLLKLIEDENYTCIQEWIAKNEKRNRLQLGIK